MHTRLAAAATLLFWAFCAASVGCAAGPSESIEPEPEQPLELSIDSVTLRRGGLRVAAKMTDGSPDVSVWPGAACRQHELGRGFATASELAWTLTSDEVAIGLECGLVFRVRARDDDGRPIVRSVTVPVAISLDTDEPLARASEIETHGGETRLVFLTTAPAHHVHVGGVVVGGPPRDRDAERTAPRHYVRRRRVTHRLHRSEFEVANADLARALVLQRPIGVGGVSFDVLATVGGASLDLEKPEDE